MCRKDQDCWGWGVVLQPGRDGTTGRKPCLPHPHHNRHPGKQDENGERPPSLYQPPTSSQLARQPHFEPCAHRDQDVATQEWTSPDVDNSATPMPSLCSHKPNTLCGLGPSQSPTPQLTGPQLPCCIRLLSACTHP